MTISSEAATSGDRAMDAVLRRYTFKLYPNKTQQVALERQAVLHVQLWNAALEQRLQQMAHERQRKPKGQRRFLGHYDQSAELKSIRDGDPEWKAMSSTSASRTLKRLDDAWKRFWSERKKGGNAGAPNFKSSKLADTIPFGKNGDGWKFTPDGKQWRLYAKGIGGLIKARGRFPDGVVKYRDMTLMKVDGAWHISIVVEAVRRRVPGHSEISIRLDLIEQFSTVEVEDGGSDAGFPARQASESHRNMRNMQQATCGTSSSEGGPEGHRDNGLAGWPCGTSSFEVESEVSTVRDYKKGPCKTSSFERRADAIQSTADRRFTKFSIRWRRARTRVAKLRSRQVRRTKHAAHVWTSGLIAAARHITLTAPADIKALTASGRGNARQWGAAVKIKAELNRRILSFAPASAIQMLTYKAEEAGVALSLIKEKSSAIGVGNELVATTKAARKAARITRKQEKKHAV